MQQNSESCANTVRNASDWNLAMAQYIHRAIEVVYTKFDRAFHF